MARDVSDATPIGARSELVDWVADGEKPAAEWRIGTEHEKIPFHAADFSPVPYEGEKSIRALLDGLKARDGWQAIVEDGHPIGLFDERGGGAISLEPGGQFELSGAPLRNLHETAWETDRHIAQVKEIGQKLGIGFLTLGMSPLWTRGETPVMPKARYRIMTEYMPKVGTLGLDMMYRTATVQVNLDYGSEADMVKKLRVSLALQPIATALFANSPFTDGKPNGFLSMRSEIWRHTDNDRAGIIPFVWEDGFGYERYVDWALDVPMYFVKRGETYHDVSGASFRDLLAGKLPQMPKRARDALRLGEPRLDPVSGSAPQALPRNARRRCRPARTHQRPLRFLGRTSLRFGSPRRRLGSHPKVVRSRPRTPAGRRPEARIESRGGGPAVAGHRTGGSCALPRRPCRARPKGCRRKGRDRVSRSDRRSPRFQVHAGGTPARVVPRLVGRFGHSRLPGMHLLVQSSPMRGPGKASSGLNGA